MVRSKQYEKWFSSGRIERALVRFAVPRSINTTFEFASGEIVVPSAMRLSSLDLYLRLGSELALSSYNLLDFLRDVDRLKTLVLSQNLNLSSSELFAAFPPLTRYVQARLMSSLRSYMSKEHAEWVDSGAVEKRPWFVSEGGVNGACRAVVESCMKGNVASPYPMAINCPRGQDEAAKLERMLSGIVGLLSLSFRR